MLSKTLQLGAAGNAGGEKVYVDDVFSTHLYTGNNSTQTITNGIDLAGEGGLVWLKKRSGSDNHVLIDTERHDSSQNFLNSNTTSGEGSSSNGITSFNSDGFSISGSLMGTNSPSADQCSWTFRKAPGFFDIVEFNTADTNAQSISHSLGSTPGTIIVKRTSDTSGWFTWHRTFSNANNYIRLDKSNGLYNLGQAAFSNVGASSFDFNSAGIIGDGHTCIAYIFAHDDQSFGTDSDEAIIKCGSYTGSSSYPKQVDVGFEPQWVLIKNYSHSGSWATFDAMRGTLQLYANSSAAEQNESGFSFAANGFELSDGSSQFNSNNEDYIYIAIRRPHKPPEAATDVFATDVGNGSSNGPAFDSNFPVDLGWYTRPTNADGMRWEARLTGGLYMKSSSTGVEAGPDSWAGFDDNNGWGENFGSNYRSWMFRRAPGFFDVVTWTGTSTSGSSSRALDHNLAATPELMIGKRRGSTGNWSVFTTTTGINNELELNKDAAVAGATNMWNGTPTNTTFTVGYALDGNNNTHIAYLFASLDGISKVGSYTGTGNNLSVNCGFAAGARFVLIKRTDSTGDWWVFDTARGIVSNGNDPALRLNLTNAQVTSTDYLEPNSNGFTVTSTAGAGLNANGGTYIYLAIA